MNRDSGSLTGKTKEPWTYDGLSFSLMLAIICIGGSALIACLFYDAPLALLALLVISIWDTGD